MRQGREGHQTGCVNDQVTAVNMQAFLARGHKAPTCPKSTHPLKSSSLPSGTKSLPADVSQVAGKEGELRMLVLSCILHGIQDSGLLAVRDWLVVRAAISTFTSNITTPFFLFKILDFHLNTVRRIQQLKNKGPIYICFLKDSTDVPFSIPPAKYNYIPGHYTIYKTNIKGL